MIRYTLLLALAAAGCSAQYQSARTLPEGKFQVTAAASSMRATGDEADAKAWAGDVQVRGGLSDRLDGGIHLGRTASFGDQTTSALMLDLKKQVTEVTSDTTVSVALPVGLAWGEANDEFGGGTYLVTPSVLLGQQLSPELELVLGAKLLVVHPDGEETRTGGGVSVGLRISDATRAWAIHPELSITKMEDADGLLYSVGLGVAAGN